MRALQTRKLICFMENCAAHNSHGIVATKSFTLARAVEMVAVVIIIL